MHRSAKSEQDSQKKLTRRLLVIGGIQAAFVGVLGLRMRQMQIRDADLYRTLAEENRMSLIISMAKSLLDFDCVDSLQQIFDKINAVTAEQLLEISNQIFDDRSMITLLFEPKQ